MWYLSMRSCCCCMPGASSYLPFSAASHPHTLHPHPHPIPHTFLLPHPSPPPPCHYPPHLLPHPTPPPPPPPHTLPPLLHTKPLTTTYPHTTPPHPRQTRHGARLHTTHIPHTPHLPALSFRWHSVLFPSCCTTFTCDARVAFYLLPSPATAAGRWWTPSFSIAFGAAACTRVWFLHAFLHALRYYLYLVHLAWNSALCMLFALRCHWRGQQAHFVFLSLPLCGFGMISVVHLFGKVTETGSV